MSSFTYADSDEDTDEESVPTPAPSPYLRPGRLPPGGTRKIFDDVPFSLPTFGSLSLNPPLTFSDFKDSRPAFQGSQDSSVSDLIIKESRNPFELDLMMNGAHRDPGLFSSASPIRQSSPIVPI